jgi:putative phage-type endonuclease
MITKIKTANHDEWLALRKKYIGGSDAAAVVGLNSYASPYSLWAEKTGRTPGFAGNLATEVGTYLEEFVAQKFAQVTGKKVRRVNYSFVNDEYPWAIANIDREVVGEDAGLEIKTTDTLNMKKFRNGEYPANYYAQAVHYLSVTGKARWYLAVLIGNKDFKWFTIERDEAEIAALMGAERDFMECVKNDTPPAVDGLKATTDALGAIYADADDTTVDLTMYRSALAEYIALGEQIAELTKQKNRAANQVRKFMGNSGAGECDGYRVTWRPQARSTFDAARFAEEHPDIDLSEFYNKTTTRMLRVNEVKGE